MIRLKKITTGDLNFARELRNKNRKYFFYDKEINKIEHEKWFKKIHKDKSLWFYIIFLGKIRIGTISYKKGEIGNVIIDKKYRHKGYLRKTIDILLEKYKGIVYLKVKHSNTKAIKAYKALGFSEKEIILWK